jgi:hypothetical protein
LSGDPVVRSRLIAAVLLAIAYCVVVATHIDYAVGGADSSGYMSEARMLASFRTHIAVEPLRELHLGPEYAHLFQPLGFIARDDGTIVPTYPAGAPIHFALAATIGGWKVAPYLVNPLAGILALVALYLLARELGLTPWLSFGAAAVLAPAPGFLSMIVQPCSDGLAIFWAIATMLFAVRALRNPRYAIFAGIAFAIGVWVRPTNLLMGLPLAFAIRWRPRLLARAIAGALPLGLALMAFNRNLYGSPFRTGYGSVAEVINFAALGHCPVFHLKWIALTFTPIIFISILVLARRATLAVWFGVFFAFYSVYDICSDWGDIRFILPAIPALILGAVLVMSRWKPQISFACIAVMMAMSIFMSWRLDPLGAAERELIWPRAVRWAEPLMPKRALVISGIYTGTFFYYADRWTLRWDGTDTDTYELLRAHAAMVNMPWYAVTSADADIKPEDFPKRYPGKWRVLSTDRDLTLWRLDE